MGTRDRRVDAYIAKSADFARPILEYIRQTVHEACPECEETLKWRSPTFMYHGMLCGMAAFKAHAIFGFWKGSLISGVGDRDATETAMGNFGRVTSVNELPPKRQLVALIKEAMKLNEMGVKLPRARKPKQAIPMPRALRAALAKNRKAKTTYDAFSPSAKRDYLEWIAEARSDETRDRRVKQAVEWMSEGKQRNWKYM